MFAKTIAASIVFCATLAPAFASAQTFKLDELTCYDVQSLAQEDSLFLIGMLIGKAIGDQDLDKNKLVTTLEKMDATCGENPEMQAIEALKS